MMVLMLMFAGSVFAADVRMYKVGDYYVGDSIITDKSMLPTVVCVRLIQNNETLWFSAEMYESHEPGVIADVTIDAYFGNEKDTDVDQIKQSCSKMDFDTGKIMTPYKQGRYNIIGYIHNQVYVFAGEGMFDQDSFYISSIVK